MLEIKEIEENTIVAYETQVTISKGEYENLVRDSEKLAILETMAKSEDILFDRNTALAVCGYVNRGGAEQ